MKRPYEAPIILRAGDVVHDTRTINPPGADPVLPGREMPVGSVGYML